jgi:hypothetical protein
MGKNCYHQIGLGKDIRPEVYILENTSFRGEYQPISFAGKNYEKWKRKRWKCKRKRKKGKEKERKGKKKRKEK